MKMLIMQRLQSIQITCKFTFPESEVYFFITKTRVRQYDKVKNR